MSLSPKTRKFIGLLILLGGLVLYAVLANEIISQFGFDNALIELPFYVTAGLLWLLPAIPLVRWMQSRDFQ